MGRLILVAADSAEASGELVLEATYLIVLSGFDDLKVLNGDEIEIVLVGEVANLGNQALIGLGKLLDLGVLVTVILGLVFGDIDELGLELRVELVELLNLGEIVINLLLEVRLGPLVDFDLAE